MQAVIGGVSRDSASGRHLPIRLAALATFPMAGKEKKKAPEIALRGLFRSAEAVGV
jgi:hypothetical protein